MRFEWDEDKRRRNVGRRGIDFLDMRQMFDGRPTHTYGSPRHDEPRFVTVGYIGQKGFAVVWTWRGEGIIRIISARRARRGEERAYRQVHG